MKLLYLDTNILIAPSVRWPLCHSERVCEVKNLASIPMLVIRCQPSQSISGYQLLPNETGLQIRKSRA